jgi:hypothetical protein
MQSPRDLKWGWLFIPASILGVGMGLMVGILFHGPAWAAYGFGATIWYLSFFTAGIMQILEN